jgi:hypothetical protein
MWKLGNVYGLKSFWVPEIETAGIITEFLNW